MEAPRQPKLDARQVFLEHYNERTRQTLEVLHNINLKVFEGELVAIVGPSGCGKTTFLNAVDGPTAPWCSSTTACFPGAPFCRT